MEIKFTCKNCGQNIAADPVHAGIHAQCPNCKNPVIVPAIEHTIKPQPAESVSPSREGWIKNEKVRREKSNQNTRVAHPQGSRIKNKSAPVQAPQKTPAPPRPNASFPSFKLGGYANEAVDFGSLTLGHIIAVGAWLLLFALGAVYLAVTKNFLGNDLFGRSELPAGIFGIIKSIPIIILIWGMRASWIYIRGIERYRAVIPVKIIRIIFFSTLVILFGGGYFLTQKNETDKVLNPLRLETELHPDLDFYWSRLAEKCVEYGKLNEAEKAAKKAIALTPLYSSNYDLLAKIYKAEGRTEEENVCIKESERHRSR